MPAFRTGAAGTTNLPFFLSLSRSCIKWKSTRTTIMPHNTSSWQNQHENHFQLGKPQAEPLYTRRYLKLRIVLSQVLACFLQALQLCLECCIFICQQLNSLSQFFTLCLKPQRQGGQRRAAGTRAKVPPPLWWHHDGAQNYQYTSIVCRKTHYRAAQSTCRKPHC